VTSKKYIKNIPRVVLFVALILLITPVMAVTVTIPTNGDTYIHHSGHSPYLGSQNFDSTDGMSVMTYEALSIYSRSAVHFDLSSIPSGASITSAKLHLYLFAIDVYPKDGVNEVHRITGSDWNANILTWFNCPAFEPIPTDSKPAGTIEDVWMVWDVTPDMQAYTSGAPMFGWIIKNPDSVSDIHFVEYHTLECTDPALRPYLEVTYTEVVPAPEFPTIALPAALIVGMLGAVLFIQRTKEN